MKLYRLFAVLALLGTLCLAAAASLALEQQQVLSSKIIRLHVIANSDSAKDQSVKIAVRDKVMEHLSNIQWKSRQEAAVWFAQNQTSLTDLCKSVLLEQGLNVPVRIELEATSYSFRCTEAAALPAGEYLSLKVIIGEGRGQNWWCVVYPFLIAEDKNNIFSSDEIRMMNEPEQVKITYAFLESWHQIKNSFQDT